jgi:hypothetical protein
MTRQVDADDLVGAAEVADILGLSLATNVSVYFKRYTDFPAPVVDLQRSRVRLWLRTDIVNWDATRSKRRGRPQGKNTPTR